MFLFKKESQGVQAFANTVSLKQKPVQSQILEALVLTSSCHFKQVFVLYLMPFVYFNDM